MGALRVLRSGRRGPQESGHPSQIVRGHHVVAAVPGLHAALQSRTSETPNGLGPAEDLLDPFPDDLTDLVASASVETAGWRSSRCIVRDREVRPDLQVDETLGEVPDALYPVASGG